MHCRHDDDGIYGLGEGDVEEAQVCSPKYAYVVGVQLDLYKLLVMGARDGDCSEESYFYRCFDDGQHRICLRVSKRDDKACEL